MEDKLMEEMPGKPFYHENYPELVKPSPSDDEPDYLRGEMQSPNWPHPNITMGNCGSAEKEEENKIRKSSKEKIGRRYIVEERADD
jgi:hypothetical protein